MPTPLPHHYRVDCVREDEHGLLTAPPRPTIVGGPPPEFDGRDGWWSPEHLLLSSVSLCFLTTFEVLARREALSLHRFASHADGTLEKTREGIVFTAITLHVELVVAAPDLERARGLLDRAKRYCIIANSLKTPITLEASLATTA
jgi:organic hydroperoxide reductase OsmC/OhrA